ncbi:hypothetical protein PIROE2DRAFT_12556 [Piromyces sp. E2]|nr:hypothetical protein PIROE2DRAFT_12556 [Piromyces sp. E2]|eukprot:OUM61455.1 hypothetical protein PIROE2DRAFT_12556 [Piromyces sp. E2]
MNINLVYSIVGFFGGILCSIADLLLDLKGKDDKEVNNIHTNWKKMSAWRFRWSINIAAIAVPMYNLGFFSLSNQVAEASPTLSIVFKVLGYLSNVLAFYIHATICYAPCIYKELQDDVKAAEKAIKGLLDGAKIPLVFGYIFLIFGMSGTVAYALIADYIHLSNFFILLTPFCTLTIGMVLRSLKHDWFYDLPGIIMPSMGIGFIGLMGALNILLN